MENFLTVLQISDSGFPTGSFSHSSGLEAAQKHGLIGKLGDLKTFAISCLENAGSLSLPFVQQAHKVASDIGQVQELDSLCEAYLSNHVANRASVRQGRSLIDTSLKTFNLTILQEIQSCISSKTIFGHYAVMYGVVCSLLGIDLDSMLLTFMSGNLKMVMASAVRLDIIGAVEAQNVQYKLQQLIPELISRNRNTPVDEACVRFPAVDVVQSMHDTQFSRLFYS